MTNEQEQAKLTATKCRLAKSCISRLCRDAHAVRVHYRDNASLKKNTYILCIAILASARQTFNCYEEAALYHVYPIP